jgi:hypothetical protein
VPVGPPRHLCRRNLTDEYLLIEYRKRRVSGYGSQNPFFNGLAVYHILEGSSMWQDPPIVKLEPADGNISPDEGLNETDFVYPDNPSLVRPMVVRSCSAAHRKCSGSRTCPGAMAVSPSM